MIATTVIHCYVLQCHIICTSNRRGPGSNCVSSIAFFLTCCHIFLPPISGQLCADTRIQDIMTVACESGITLHMLSETRAWHISDHATYFFKIFHCVIFIHAEHKPQQSRTCFKIMVICSNAGDLYNRIE